MSEFQPFKFNIGRYQCAVIRDGGHMGKAGFVFANAPEGELNQALQDHHLEPDKITSSWNCLFVDTGDKKLLVDTGFGPRDGLPEGKLIETLREIGVHPDQIDLLFLSHGHPDHIGGCTDADGRLLYPNARFLMAQAEWDFWTTESNLSDMMDIFGRFARKNLPPLKEKLDFVDDGMEILPGISILMAPGHTPGHFGLHIANEDEAFYFLADAFLHPLQIEHPDWTAVVDLDPEQVIATRHQLLERVAGEQKPVLFYHFDFPAIGTVLKSQDKWRWLPVDSST